MSPATLDSNLEERKLFLERAKFFREHVQTVINLATGSLVLSVTFLHDKSGTLKRTGCLKVSWAFLVAAIVFGSVYNYFLSLYTKRHTKPSEIEEYAKREKLERVDALVLSLLSGIFHLLFVGALILVLLFGIANV
ncbi:MAG TPA: hypothetical protein VG649_20680 [Candidatus Angelobacter sp.]|jgi:hypothetical protein|nr:hypothetical protein [Candidatus Angelobacter sp.]